MNDAKNNYDVLENEIDAQNNEDGIIVLPEENIVSDEEENPKI